jgi:hypothetical protein
MKLYEITEQYKSVMDLAENGDVSNQVIADTLESIEGEITAKAENILAMMTNAKAAVPAIDEQIKRLQDIKRQIESRENWFKEYILVNMQKADINKIECPLFKITRRKGSQAVEITNDDLIPDEYINTKVVVSADKRRILKDLKEGKEIEGATLTIGKESILIK